MSRLGSLRINAELELPAEELRCTFARAGGPGGQNVNKLETKVVLRFDVEGSPTLGERHKAALRERLAAKLTAAGELVVHASRHRTRERNIEDARQRLALLLRAGLARPRPRKPTRPTRASKQRRLSGKRRQADKKRGRAGEDA